MYITKLKLTNIRNFKELTIPFPSRNSSLLISGHNGDGKSTILRCIAMGLCDQSSAAALQRELSGEFINKDSHDKPGTITVELTDRDNSKYKIITTFSSIGSLKSISQFESISQQYIKSYKGDTKKLSQEDFPWNKIFVSGYGAGVRAQGTADYQHYLAVDAVYPLFRYDVQLQNPELVIRRILDIAREKLSKIEAEEFEEEILTLLNSVLNLSRNEKIKIKKNGLFLRTRGKDIELGAVGDGYRATATLLLDLFSWWMLHTGMNFTRRSIRGIVLIDEVEQHLHPRWQIEIMDLLSDAFPDVQFIATTHSPLIISGSKKVPVLPLNQDASEPYLVRGWRAEDVYREVMGMQSSQPRYINEIEKRFQDLELKILRKQANKREKLERNKLRKVLEQLSGTDPTLVLSKIDALDRFLKG